MIKVALIDNMNNNFFAFGRYLRDLGIDIHLYEIPNLSMEHFMAQSDTFENISKMNWIKKFPCSINNKNWFFLQKRKIYNEFKNYDLIISCGFSSAYLKNVGLNSDIIIPYGSDLYEIPFRNIKLSFSLDFIRSIFWFSQATWQQKAYKEARCVITNRNHKIYNHALLNMNIDGINSSVPMLYNKEKVRNIEKFNFLRNYDFIVFNHSRQMWCSNPNNFKDFDKYKGNKRNDKTIKAFAEFLKITNFKNPLLVLFKYGPDVECSKQLIKALAIEKNVKWMPKSYRKEIMYGLSFANFGVDQIRENIAGTGGGTTNEVMASGLPLLTYSDGSLEDKESIFYRSPVVEVLTEEDILNVFIDYEKNPLKYKDIGKQAKEWFNENLGIGLAKKYVELIELLAKDKTLTQNDKIVREIFEK